ncbi:DUF5412 family protein [Paenibacillus piscarius]|uniref:DUF5412 family protein n=1 Tax=Paenibacillus piscarius TaxID=1089681 RepID=UPI001EE82280|nr:DUF5412 family protein [Paenibacillus piscarius]
MNNQLYIGLLVGAIIFGVTGLISLIISLILLIRMAFNKKTAFPKRSLITAFITGAGCLLFFYNQQNNINFLPKGYLNSTFESPDKKYEIRTYHYGSLFYRNARAELINKSNNNRSTIYFNDYDYSPLVTWKTNEVVLIGNVELDISKHQTFDYRKIKNHTKSVPPQS